MVREQPSTTLVIIVVQVPPLHVKSVRGLVREPDSAHSLAKLHDDGVPKVGVPQGTPFVEARMHDCISVVVVGMHVAPMQRYVVRWRDWVPVSVQTSLPKSQLLQPENWSAGHSPSFAHAQVDEASLHMLAPLGHGLPACVAHVPPAQVSAPLQNTPSLHGSVLFVVAHPVAGLHTSSVQRTSSSQSASTGMCSHPSAPQRSRVHAIPSSQPIATHALPQHDSPSPQVDSRRHTSPSQRAV